MIDSKKIGVVIPCYMGGEVAINVTKEAIEIVDLVVLVDDACPLSTGKKLQERLNSPKLHVLYHKRNQGVGAATKRGFQWLLDQGCDIIVKLDSDAQMDPRYFKDDFANYQQ